MQARYKPPHQKRDGRDLKSAPASDMPKKNQAASVMIRKNKETDPLAARAVALTE